ncbi:aspartyl-phosphate phosphatase Spo0E family protein [Neobacillus sp. YIM B06451]|uniref:aspartyl-phosphate phosphatase Spo0E family protein n=1 Tax=Neobacillus sp. YIM B06451 TaxID=3070994 RepID=UPI00292E9316|nr:aspartyl-phosphate phosphatase Spo0E family protein [Neobacillus sp. YIM B06451]
MNSFDLLNLLDEIKMKRKVMIDSAIENGLTNERTIQYSQELDELIVAYQKARQTSWQPENGSAIFLTNWRKGRTTINRERLAVSSAI